MLKTILTTLSILIALSLTALLAQDKGGKGKGKGFTLPPMSKISITGFADGGRIPARHTCASGQQAGNPSPAISWSGAPATTQSYALIFHDPDPVLQGSATNDVLHWAIFDIPGDSKGLPEAVPAMAELADGSKQPNGISGMPGYFGPCPPAGHGDHHYTFELFALNAKLGLPASTSRADLMNAMNGKVVAKGIYIGMFGQQ
jgi:Raf kinase inhibitor-like YbhB/YbcL family protein